MKKISLIILSGVVFMTSSCKKWFDINTNPNSATAAQATYNLLMPQALAYTAIQESGFNSYGSQIVYVANAGGYGSLGALVNYAYTPSDFTALWNNSYDNMEDYKAIIDQTATDPTLIYYNACSKIMSCILFQNLVDAYNDVPYFDALNGASKYTPKYDSARVIYKSLADTLDVAIAEINAGLAAGNAVSMGNSDVMFANNMVKWKQLANTIKLRLLVVGNGKVSFSNNTFSSDGFLTTDALVNPGYAQSQSSTSVSQQNPRYDARIWTYTGTPAYKVWLPSTYVMAFYDGNKIIDSGRGKAMFYQYPNTGTNRMGVQLSTIPTCPDGTFWWPTTNRAPGATTGAFKGPNAGAVIITAAEGYFLQAEAALKGIITGDVAALFQSGVRASFNYVYMLPSNSVSGDPNGDATKYFADNATNNLVNFALNTTNDQKLEAIITQKYIALNMISGDQAWNDYRRTHYPTISTSPSASAMQTFVSTVSTATRPDKLPARIAYPTNEVSYNSANMPRVDVFTSQIFWALP